MQYLSNCMTNFNKTGITLHINYPNLMDDQMFKNLKIQDGGWQPS